MYDHKMLKADSLIGEFEVDASQIFFEHDHSILYKWITIINPEKDFQAAKGFLKFSACLVNGT